MEIIRFCKIERGGDVVYLNNDSFSSYGIEYSEDSPAGLYLTVSQILEEADKAGVTKAMPQENCVEHTGRLIKWIHENYKDSGIKAEYVGPVFDNDKDDGEDLYEGLSEEDRKELAELNKRIKSLTVE